MFTKYILILVCLLGLTAFSQEVKKFPELQPITLRWKHENSDGDVITFWVYSDAVLVKTFPASELAFDASTGFFKATIISPSKGSANLTVVSVNELGMASDPSNILPLKFLGKPLAPKEFQTP